MKTRHPKTPPTSLAADLPTSAPLRRFLDQVAEDPERAYRNRRRRAPSFCQRYFDLCDANALECDRSALERPDLVLGPARIAVELAERSGDRHLVNRSLGVVAHAHLAVEQSDEASDVLAAYRRQALRCCASCRADWYFRHGDTLVERRDAAAARRSLNSSLRATEHLDGASRVGFVHGISHYYLERRDAAIDAELRVLESLDLTSPRGYFIDAVAMLAVFLRGAEPGHDRRVLRGLEAFKRRLGDVRGWTVVRIRLRWLEGQLHARLGHVRWAFDRLESVRRYLFEHGPWRQAAAVILDLAQIYCRHDYGDNFRTARTMLRRCYKLIPADATGEDGRLRAGLETLTTVLHDKPELAVDALVALRASFVVPVPGLVSERFVRGPGIVLPGRLRVSPT